MKFLSIILLATILSASDGHRILGVFPFQASSHFTMFGTVLKGLAGRGHQVDVISPFPLKKPYPNYTDVVVLTPAWQFTNNFTYADMSEVSSPVIAVSTLGGNEVCKELANPGIQRILKNPPNDPPYDLVLTEIFGAHCFAAVGHVLKVPVVGVSSAILYPWCNDMIANPENMAFAPSNLLPLGPRMNLMQRIQNTVNILYNKWYFNYLTAEQDDLIKKYVGPDVPGVRKLESQISLVLTNSHLSLNGIKPMTPALVEVGGLHVHEEGVELPASLEKWMNESTSGFVYFTFGSMVKIESFPPEFIEILYKSLGKIAPVRVLMKIPDPSALPPGLPKNIHILPWIPQVKVLKHRNIKAFITHGGLMGTQEAVHYGVPLIGIPLFADQFINIDTYVRSNIAVSLDLKTLTVEKLDEALNAILKDPKYRDTMKKISRKFLDRPLSSLDTAIYWIEYIIRHGADALRSPAIDLTWWQVELLDVYACLFLIAITAIYVAIIVLHFAYNLVSPWFFSSNASRLKKIS